MTLIAGIVGISRSRRKQVFHFIETVWLILRIWMRLRIFHPIPSTYKKLNRYASIWTQIHDTTSGQKLMAPLRAAAMNFLPPILSLRLNLDIFRLLQMYIATEKECTVWCWKNYCYPLCIGSKQKPFVSSHREAGGICITKCKDISTLCQYHIEALGSVKSVFSIPQR